MKEAVFLKKARKLTNLTQTELSVKLGFGSGQFCSNWERGASSLPPQKMRSFIRITGADPDELVKVKTSDYKKWLRSLL